MQKRTWGGDVAPINACLSRSTSVRSTILIGACRHQVRGRSCSHPTKREHLAQWGNKSVQERCAMSVQNFSLVECSEYLLVSYTGLLSICFSFNSLHIQYLLTFVIHTPFPLPSSSQSTKTLNHHAVQSYSRRSRPFGFRCRCTGSQSATKMCFGPGFQCSSVHRLWH